MERKIVIKREKKYSKEGKERREEGKKEMKETFGTLYKEGSKQRGKNYNRRIAINLFNVSSKDCYTV